MKLNFLVLLIAASAAAASSQSPVNPAIRAASAALPAAADANENCSTASAGIALPADIPPVTGNVQSVFALRYQDYVVGTGPVAEPDKLYKVQYTYWLAANGQKIDSTYDHPGPPIKDADGKMVLGPDGKPRLSGPLTVNFIQGRHQMIWGFDQGVLGMRVGGKRRLYIPWQLAWGPMGHPPAIPPMSDMIYDVELVDVVDLPVQQLPNTGRSGLNNLRQRRPPADAEPASGTAAPATPAAQPQSK